MKLGDAIEIYVRDYPATGIRANPPPPTPMVWARGLYLFAAMSVDKHWVARMYLGRWVPVAHEIGGEHIRPTNLEEPDDRPAFSDRFERTWRKEPNGDLVLEGGLSDARATPDEWLRKLVVDDEMQIRRGESDADRSHVVLTLQKGSYPIDADGYMTARLLVSQEKRR